MSRLIFRPFFVLLTLAMLVVALFQVSGRLMFAVLDELEGGVNQWLTREQVVLKGLAGDWRGINPVITVERIDLPAGYLSGLRVEMDWLESLVRNRLVARRVTLEEGRVALERTEAGWRLLGAREGADFDPIDTIYHSDELDIGLTLAFVGPDGEAESRDDIDLVYRAINRGGRHVHRLGAANRDCETTCRVELDVDEAEAILFLRPRSVAASVSGSGLRLPEPLLAGRGGVINVADGQWWRRGEDSGGTLSFAFAGLAVGDGELLEGGLTVRAAGQGDVHHLELADTYLATDRSRFELPEVWMTYEDGLLQAWTPEIETGSGFEFLAALAPRDTAVYRWLSALRVEAYALNVHGFVKVPGLAPSRAALPGSVLLGSAAREPATGFSATVRNVSLDGYNGAPWIRGGAGELLGADRSIQLSLNADDLGVQFPDVFHQRWVMDHLNGNLRAFIGADYFGLRGINVRAELDGSRVAGGFALTRPNDRYRERLTLMINVDQTTVARGKQYIPYRLPAGLPEWLEHGPRAGRLEQVSLAYQGQIHTRPFELSRRVEFGARISEGDVQYHPDWPMVHDLSGRIAVAGREVRIHVDEGRNLAATDLSGTRIRLGDNASFADIELESSTSVAEALEFVRTTPLAEWMSFVTPDWAGEGPLRMSGSLHIPLKLEGEHIGEQSLADEVAVDLDIELMAADLDLPSYGVSLGDLAGAVHYVYPYRMSARGVRGRIFDRPAIFGASSDEDTVIFHVAGQAPYEEVLTLLDVADPGVVRGGFDFIADLHIETADSISRLDVVSDLTGLELALPGELAKGPNEAVPTELELRFLPEYQSVRFRYGHAQGWLHVDEVPLRGAIGFASAPPIVDTAVNELVLGGRVEGFNVQEVVPDGEGGPMLTLPVRLAGLEVGAIDVNGMVFRDAILSGSITAAPSMDLTLSIDSPDLVGTLALIGDQPLDLNLALLRLPETEDDGGDPLSVDVIAELMDANVNLEQLFVGESDYGGWSFELRPADAGLELNALHADLRGVVIAAERVFWAAEENRSFFEGTMAATDLADVLPQWGYAPSVTTEEAMMEATLSWRGSPAAVDLDRLVGQASFEASNGRFLDVTASGTDAMRIFSLVNFSKIAKRLNFDFSDVVGEGVSFDTLTATSEFDEGMMHFIEPMAVEGSGSSFRVAGTVNLVEGTLDNEMIVTLPVTKGLPWYAAYVALANPLAGLGVLVGERVLRKPLEQFSSGKYEVSGTLDDPELKFLGVWDTRMDRPQASLEQTDGDLEGDGTEGTDEADTTPPEQEEAVSQNTEATTG